MAIFCIHVPLRFVFAATSVLAGSLVAITGWAMDESALRMALVGLFCFAAVLASLHMFWVYYRTRVEPDEEQPLRY
jgi:urea transporter